jgi:hypothetical protein
MEMHGSVHVQYGKHKIALKDFLKQLVIQALTLYTGIICK